MNEIFTITTCEKLEANEFGWPEFGDIRTIGWYPSFIEAEWCVRQNWGDIWETCYTYAIIEWVEPGLYPSTKRWYYKWNKGGYEPIEEPICMKHIANISIG